jgi:hypothetical protein
MRKSFLLFAVIGLLILGDLLIVSTLQKKEADFVANSGNMRLLVQELGLSDLAVTTEARYTRHPAVSDPVAPFMDHPGDIEHFPSGSFLRPVE